MSRCNKALQAEGAKAWPRTCAKCGLGPCKEEQRRENAALKAVAGHIQKLSYRDMRTFADIVGNHIPGDKGGPDAVANGLLAAADAIMNADKKSDTPQSPMPAPSEQERADRLHAPFRR